MGWGIDFKADLFISRVTTEEVDSQIEYNLELIT